ncbi:hypothetical protein LIER_05470 [Lithospermum erythrorhizon]|uniref:Uncharacterized protein n=1 Tax=Lithospermum erythrorhizon TaxID=34254 RepID=A0AAV3P2H1_LITER
MDKEERNPLRRDRYKVNIDEINKRRRKVYSEKRRHLEFANESSNANTAEVHPMLDKLPNCDQNIFSINVIPSSTNQHVFHASVLTSSDLRSVVANDDAIEHRLTESILPEYLVQLITGTDERSKEFQNMIQTYNNHFAFTTIGITCDNKYQRRDRGIYTVKV